MLYVEYIWKHELPIKFNLQYQQFTKNKSFAAVSPKKKKKKDIAHFVLYFWIKTITIIIFNIIFSSSIRHLSSIRVTVVTKQYSTILEILQSFLFVEHI